MGYKVRSRYNHHVYVPRFRIGELPVGIPSCLLSTQLLITFHHEVITDEGKTCVEMVRQCSSARKKRGQASSFQRNAPPSACVPHRRQGNMKVFQSPCNSPKKSFFQQRRRATASYPTENSPRTMRTTKLKKLGI